MRLIFPRCVLRSVPIPGFRQFLSKIRFSTAINIHLIIILDKYILQSFPLWFIISDDTGNVPAEVIATDILGLMKQELPEKQLTLNTLLLYLLDMVIKYSPSDELRGNTLPISMLPLFFDIQV